MMKRGHDVESAPGIWRWRTAVEHYVGIDVSLELSSVCVVDGRGKIVKEAKVASEPEALVCFFNELGFPVNGLRFRETGFRGQRKMRRSDLPTVTMPSLRTNRRTDPR